MSSKDIDKGMSSKDIHEERLHSMSDNIDIMNYDKADEQVI